MIRIVYAKSSFYKILLRIHMWYQGFASSARFEEFSTALSACMVKQIGRCWLLAETKTLWTTHIFVPTSPTVAFKINHNYPKLSNYYVSQELKKGQGRSLEFCSKNLTQLVNILPLRYLLSQFLLRIRFVI